MREYELAFVLFIFIVIFIVIFILYLIAKKINKNKTKYNEQSFIWGYYQFVSSILGSFIFFIYGIDNDRGIYIFLSILNLVIGYLLYKKYKIAAVLTTVFSFNPVIWIINYIYFKKRWHELKSLNEKSLTLPTTENKILSNLSPPSYLWGTWVNERYTIVISDKDMNIFEHESGNFKIPSNIVTNVTHNTYEIHYQDPFLLTEVSIECTLISEKELQFVVHRGSYIVEIREVLRKAV